jgi:hypothetical protein
MVPSFWFEYKILKTYGAGLIRLNQGYLTTKLASAKTISDHVQKLTKLNLGK